MSSYHCSMNGFVLPTSLSTKKPDGKRNFLLPSVTLHILLILCPQTRTIANVAARFVPTHLCSGSICVVIKALNLPCGYVPASKAAWVNAKGSPSTLMYVWKPSVLEDRMHYIDCSYISGKWLNKDMLKERLDNVKNGIHLHSWPGLDAKLHFWLSA